MFDGEPEKRRLRDSIGFKMIAVGGLVVLMLIPLGMVGSLIGEREAGRRRPGRRWRPPGGRASC